MKTSECISRDTLKQYLAGWIDDPQTTEIELHLQRCEACEQTVIELDGKPDTIFEPLRGAGDSPLDSIQANILLKDAVEKAERLVPRESISSSSQLQPISQTLGPYRLIRRLGAGGMGAVYLARHNKLDKHVAIKLLPASWAANEEVAARFRREITAAGKLNHPSIVSATDAGELDGMHYLVMEYVEGVDLSQLSRGVGPFRVADACELMRRVALGLSNAHAEGIVHRDVKPSNVMLDNRGQVKVLDFGLAQLHPWDGAAAELTSVGQLMGTLDYMAPEQAERPNGVDYRADLYSVGATLFRLLTGRPPLAAAPSVSPLEKLRLLADHIPPRLDTLRPDAPAALVELVASLLARRPDARPASAAHVAEQLAPFCSEADLVALSAQAPATEDSTYDAPGQFTQLPWLVPASAQSAKGAAAMQKNSRPWISWLISAGLTAVLIIAGVLIVLETRKGQLVIESEVAGVQVKVLNDGQVVDQFRLETGTTSTRLYADKYEIVLEHPSDSITIENSQFLLKSGTTVVARVRQQDAAVGDALVNPLAESQELLYDGKSLNMWLSQLSRERSPKALGDALTAIDAMISADTAAQITQVLSDTLPSLDANVAFVVGNSRTTVDHAAFRILTKTNPGPRYFALLAELLEDADAAWGTRILTSGVWAITASSHDEMEPVLRWMETQAFADSSRVPAHRELVTASGWIIRLLLESDDAGDGRLAIERRFLPLMDKSPHLDGEFWLAVPPQATWPTELRRAVVRRAVQALEDTATNSKITAQAAMILTEELSTLKDSVRVDVEVVTSAVRRRLASLADDPAHLWNMTDVEHYFIEQVAPRCTGAQISVTDSKASVTLELLDLVAALRSASEAEPFEVAFIIEATSEAYRKVAPAIPSGASFRGRFVQLSWPNLDSFTSFGRPPNTELTPTDLLGYLICVRAAEVAELPLPALESEATPAEVDSGLSR